jgi:hypothetical protein
MLAAMAESLDLLCQVARELLCRGQHEMFVKSTKYKGKEFSLEYFLLYLVHTICVFLHVSIFFLMATPMYA